MVEMTVRMDRSLRDAIRKIAAEETAATKEEVSVAALVRQALRDMVRRKSERAQREGKAR